MFVSTDLLLIDIIRYRLNVFDVTQTDNFQLSELVCWFWKYSPCEIKINIKITYAAE
jgi:hypothetical protein